MVSVTIKCKAKSMERITVKSTVKCVERITVKTMVRNTIMGIFKGNLRITVNSGEHYR